MDITCQKVSEAINLCLAATEHHDLSIRAAVTILQGIDLASVPEELQEEVRWIINQSLDRSEQIEGVKSRIAYLATKLSVPGIRISSRDGKLRE